MKTTTKAGLLVVLKFLLLFALQGCKKEPMQGEKFPIEGAYLAVHPTKMRFIFLDGTLFRDRFNGNDIDQSFEFQYSVSDDTLRIEPLFNLVGRTFIASQLQGDTILLFDITATVPFNANLKLVRY